MADDTIITRYRPREFDELIGQVDQMAALRRAMASNSAAHAYLLTGPSGVGKTTVARLIASYFEAETIEIDAAVFSGVDEMRQLLETSAHLGLRGLGRRLYLLNECFAPGTLVATAAGDVPIEYVHPGDMVLGATGMQRVRSTLTNKVPVARIVRLRFADRPPIICADTHPLLTTSGWLEAGNATHADVFTTRTAIPARLLQVWDSVHQRRHGQSILHALPGANLSRMLKNLRAIIQTPAHADHMLGGLRQSGGSEKAIIPETAGVAAGAAGCAATGTASRSGEIPRYQQGNRRADASQQPEPQRGYSREEQSYQGGEGDSSRLGRYARRQWTADHGAEDFVAHAAMPGRVLNRDLPRQDGGLAESVHCRSGVPGAEAGDRGGWQGAQLEDTARSGRAEDRTAGNARLARVTSIERGGAALAGSGVRTYHEDSTDYAIFHDLEIDSHPSYSANGLIVHNCQRLSKGAFDALLTTLEEPPEHLFFALTTTEPEKVPHTIKTRCYEVRLKGLNAPELHLLLDAVSAAEGWSVHNDVAEAIVQEADGSARQLLSLLQVGHDVRSTDELRRIITLRGATDPIKQLCTMLLNHSQPRWPEVAKLLLQIDFEDPSFESTAIASGRYLIGVMLKSKREDSAKRAWQLLEALVFPVATFDRKAQFMSAMGKIVWSGV